MTVEIYAAFDAARIGAISCTLTETGGGGASGAINLTGHYMWSWDVSSIVADMVVFETALKAALDAVGNATYTVTFSGTTGKITITASGGGVTAFALTARSSAMNTLLGTTGAISGSLSHVGTNRSYYFIDGEIGCVTDYTGFAVREKGGIAKDLWGHDGEHYGVAQSTAPRLLEATIPLEPLVKLTSVHAPTTDPWTWEHFFAHARNIEPWVIYVDFGAAFGAGGSELAQLCKLREDGASFTPGLVGGDYHAVQDVPLRAIYLGDVTP